MANNPPCDIDDMVWGSRIKGNLCGGGRWGGRRTAQHGQVVGVSVSEHLRTETLQTTQKQRAACSARHCVARCESAKVPVAARSKPSRVQRGWAVANRVGAVSFQCPFQRGASSLGAYHVHVIASEWA
jgi:hypothetical protein